METYYTIQAPGYKARHMDLIKQEVLKYYQTMMDTSCGGPEIVSQFDAVHTQAHLKALEGFNTAVNKYNLHDYPELFADINKVRSRIFHVNYVCFLRQHVIQTFRPTN
jgi:hypothetical protein